VVIVDADLSNQAAEPVSVQALPQRPGRISADRGTLNRTAAITIRAAGSDLIGGSSITGGS